MLRFIGDLGALRQWVSLGLARLSVAAVTTLGVLTALLLVNPMLMGLVALLLFAGGASALLFGRSLQSATHESRKWRARMAGNVSEKLEAMAVVQAYGQRRRERRREQREKEREREAALLAAAPAVEVEGLVEISPKGFGFLHSKPRSALSPVLVTPDELGGPGVHSHDPWRGTR